MDSIVPPFNSPPHPEPVQTKSCLDIVNGKSIKKGDIGA